MKIPFIDIKRIETGFMKDWLLRVSEISEQAAFISGDTVRDMERQLADFVQVKNVISCGNGTDALQLALRASGVGPGDKVLLPDMTFWATFEAIVNVGAAPVTVDIDPNDGGIDLESFRLAIKTEKPKVALIAHLYGWGTGDLDLLRTYCKEESVILVEDGAQCFGSEWQSEPIYKGAHISTTSFYPAKVLGAAGDGGAIFTQDDNLAEKVRCLANHGRSSHYGYKDVGWNSRMDALQCAYVTLALQKLEMRIASRLDSATYYRKNLSHAGVTVLDVPAGYKENGYCNVLTVEDPDLKIKIEDRLKECGISFGNIYPGSMSSQPPAKTFSAGHYGGHEADAFASKVLNLPLFPYMTTAELDYIIDIMNKV